MAYRMIANSRNNDVGIISLYQTRYLIIIVWHTLASSYCSLLQYSIDRHFLIRYTVNSTKTIRSLSVIRNAIETLSCMILRCLWITNIHRDVCELALITSSGLHTRFNYILSACVHDIEHNIIHRSNPFCGLAECG